MRFATLAPYYPVPYPCCRFVCSSVIDERIKESADFVRGFLYLSAWHAKPSSTDPSQCEAQYIVHTNIKGSLPVWVVTKGIVGEMAETFHKIRKILKEQK